MTATRTQGLAALILFSVVLTGLGGSLSLAWLNQTADARAELRIEQSIGATLERRRPWGWLSSRSTRGQIVVTSVAASGAARASGLRPGDLIVADGTRPLHSLAEVASVLDGTSPRSLTVDREGARLQLTVAPHFIRRKGSDLGGEVADRGG